MEAADGDRTILHGLNNQSNRLRLAHTSVSLTLVRDKMHEDTDVRSPAYPLCLMGNLELGMSTCLTVCGLRTLSG